MYLAKAVFCLAGVRGILYNIDRKFCAFSEETLVLMTKDMGMTPVYAVVKLSDDAPAVLLDRSGAASESFSAPAPPA